MAVPSRLECHLVKPRHLDQATTWQSNSSCHLHAEALKSEPSPRKHGLARQLNPRTPNSTSAHLASSVIPHHPRRRAEALEAELSSLTRELASLSSASADLAALEERYWHDANEFELLLAAHTDERGALLARIDRASQRLQLLKSTNVLHDAFKIWWVRVN